MNGKHRSQARAVQDTVRFLLPRVLLLRRPADREIADYFRTHRSLGSHDRRMIYDIAFAVFRWWGWLRRLLPASAALPLSQACRTRSTSSARQAEKALDALPAPEWSRLLLGAVIAEGLDFPHLSTMWRNALPPMPVGHAEGAVPGKASSLSRRAKTLFQALDCPELCPADPVSALLPAWQHAILPCPEMPREISIRALLERPPTWVRARKGYELPVLRELRGLGMEAVPHPTLPCAVRISDCHVNLYNQPGFRKGWYEIQDLSSQVVGFACNPVPGQSWWDACAGAGGKTLLLADHLAASDRILATDIRHAAVRRLLGRAQRCGFRTLRAVTGDIRRIRLGKGDVFDGVLVDAPCSGSGTWGRNPDARWRLCPADLERLPRLQFELLTAAAPHVRPGGCLVYATCSVFPIENQQVTARFLELYRDFDLDPFPNPLAPDQQTDGTLAILPWEHPANGMFIARMKRRR